jgi:hypothetical protein
MILYGLHARVKLSSPCGRLGGLLLRRGRARGSGFNGNPNCVNSSQCRRRRGARRRRGSVAGL